MLLAGIGEFVWKIVRYARRSGYATVILDRQVRQIMQYENPTDEGAVLTLSLSRDDADIRLSDQLLPERFFWHDADCHIFAYFPPQLAHMRTLSPILLASGNLGKVAEYDAFFEDVAVTSIGRDGGHLLDILEATEETGATFIANALIKSTAVAAHAPMGSKVLADDSGFCLNGVDWGEFEELNVPGAEAGVFPGVYTKRFVKKISPEKMDYADAFHWISDHCGGIRQAYYECAIALTHVGDLLESIVVSGQVKGDFTMPPRYGDTGFGFDPVFRPEGHSRTYSQMQPEEKAANSHRAVAVQKIRQLFTD